MIASAIDKTCYTCRVPALNVINSSICSGWRERDGGFIRRAPECSTWQVATTTWSITEAIAFTAFFNMRMSRPTVIKICTRIGACRRKPGCNDWLVDAAQFREFLIKRKGQ